MKIYKSIEQFLNSKIEVDNFIPTMGNLHEGHLSLIDKAKENTGNICVSIYVNENQFNNKKDFDNYPITLDLDVKKLKSKNIWSDNFKVKHLHASKSQSCLIKGSKYLSAYFY